MTGLSNHRRARPLGELDRKVIELRYGLSDGPREAAETAELLGDIDR